MSQNTASSCQISADPKDLALLNNTVFTNHDGQLATLQIDGSQYCIRGRTGPKGSDGFVSMCAPTSSLPIACKNHGSSRVCLTGNTPDDAVTKCQNFH